MILNFDSVSRALLCDWLWCHPSCCLCVFVSVHMCSLLTPTATEGPAIRTATPSTCPWSASHPSDASLMEQLQSRLSKLISRTAASSKNSNRFVTIFFASALVEWWRLLTLLLAFFHCLRTHSKTGCRRGMKPFYRFENNICHQQINSCDSFKDWYSARLFRRNEWASKLG